MRSRIISCIQSRPQPLAFLLSLHLSPLAAYPEPWVRGCDAANRPMCSPGTRGLAILVRPGVLPFIHLVGTILTQSAPRPNPSPIALMTAAGWLSSHLSTFHRSPCHPFPSDLPHTRPGFLLA